MPPRPPSGSVTVSLCVTAFLKDELQKFHQAQFVDKKNYETVSTSTFVSAVDSICNNLILSAAAVDSILQLVTLYSDNY